MMRGTAVSGGQQRRATWNTFAGFPCQVEGGKRHLKRFCRDSVPGGQRDGTPETLLQGFRALLQGFRARWAAGWDT